MYVSSEPLFALATFEMIAIFLLTFLKATKTFQQLKVTTVFTDANLRSNRIIRTVTHQFIQML